MGLFSRTAFSVLGLAVLLAVLGDRQYALWLMIKNRPDWLPSVSAFSDYKFKLEDQVRNCEDVVIEANRGFAILSCDAGRDKWNTVMGTFVDSTNPGSLWMYDYSKFGFEDAGHAEKFRLDGFSETQLKSFHPLGMGYWPETGTLYVTNHAESGPTIEIFQLEGETTLKYQRTVSHPLLNTPNSILAISENEIYITNDHQWKKEDNPVKSLLETYAAYPGGSVVYVNLKTDTYEKLLDLPFANGITALNSTHIAVASTSQPAVLIYQINPETKGLIETQKLRPSFMVDNLSTDGKGNLLMAGHPHAPVLEKVAKTNRLFDIDGTGQGRLASERPKAPSWVAEWDGNVEGNIRDLYVSTEFSTSATAARDVDRGVGIVVGLYEKGILLWKE